MFMKRSKSTASRRQALTVAAALCAAMASGAAFAQTAFGASTTIVFPVVASTGTFTGTVTVYNPNASDVTVTLDYFDANNLPAPGAKVCSDLLVPAGASVQFNLAAQCTLEPGSHFGLLTVADSAGTSAIVGYSRTENSAGAGFSIEGFPLTNFTSDVSNTVGLRRSAAPPTYQTNCFVAALGGAVTYDLKLFDGSTGAQIGNTLSASLNPFEEFRYLDIFAAASAPAGDYANVRAEFTRTNGDPQPLVGFCTVQDNVSFGADFRIAKDSVPASQPTATVQWNGVMTSIGSNQNVYAFAGPTATVPLVATANVTANGSATVGINSGTKAITLNVCYQNQSGPGPVTAMGDPNAVNVTPTLTTYAVSGVATLSPGTYSIGVCATNPSLGPVNKNGNTLGVVTVSG